MEDNALDFMKHIMPDDAAIATYTVEGTYRPLYCFVPADQPVDFLDVAACIEETLHILREAASAQSEPQGKAEDLIRNVLGLERRDILVDRDISEDDMTEIRPAGADLFLPASPFPTRPCLLSGRAGLFIRESRS